MFSSRNKKNIDTFWLKKAPYQELCLNALLYLSQNLNRSISQCVDVPKTTRWVVNSDSYELIEWVKVLRPSQAIKVMSSAINLASLFLDRKSYQMLHSAVSDLGLQFTHAYLSQHLG